MKNQLLNCVLAAVGFALSPVSSAVIIDNFDVGSGSISSTGVTPSAPVASLNIPGTSGAIGGSRTTIIPKATGAGVTSSVNTASSTRRYRHTNPQGTSGTSLLIWDANGLLGGLNGVDLTDGGNDNAVEVNVVQISVGSVTVEFTVTSPTGSSSLAADNVTLGQQAFLFRDFGDTSGSGADFTNVDSIELTLIAAQGAEVQLSLVQTGQGQDSLVGISAPLPGTAALMGIALALLVRGGRRQPQLRA